MIRRGKRDVMPRSTFIRGSESRFVQGIALSRAHCERMRVTLGTSRVEVLLKFHGEIRWLLIAARPIHPGTRRILRERIRASLQNASRINSDAQSYRGGGETERRLSSRVRMYASALIGKCGVEARSRNKCYRSAMLGSSFRRDNVGRILLLPLHSRPADSSRS